MHIQYRIIAMLLHTAIFSLDSYSQGTPSPNVVAKDIDINQLLAEKIIAFRLFYDESQQNTGRELGFSDFGYEINFNQLDFDSGHCIRDFRFRAPETGYYHIDMRIQPRYYVEPTPMTEDCEDCGGGFVDNERELLLYTQKDSRQILKIHSKVFPVSQQETSSYPFSFSTTIKIEKGTVIVPLFTDSYLNYSFASFSGFKIY